MRSGILAKVSNCFLFLAVGFSILFSPFVIKAQDTSKTECECKYRYVCKNVYEDRYNGTTNRYEPRLVYKPVWEYACGCGNMCSLPTSEGQNSNTGKLSEIRASDLVGTWEGLFDKAQCTLEIEKVDGNTFYGTLKRQGGSVAVTGTIKDRSISFNSTKGMLDKLGYNWGSFSNDGNLISGKGANDLTSYEWSFTKKNLKSENNPRPTTKVSLSLTERLPEQLGEFKQVRLDKHTVIKNFIRDSEEYWYAEYQTDKNSKATIELYRYKDSAGAIKRRESEISNLKTLILRTVSIENQDGQVIGELAIWNTERTAFLRNANYFYLIDAKDKVLFEKMLKYLPLE